MLKIKKGYSFDDLLLVPKKSSIRSRGDVDLRVDLGKGVVLQVPFISANMKTITGDEMALAIARAGGLGLMHRFDTVDNIVEAFELADLQTKSTEWIGASCGAAVSDRGLIDRLVDAGCKVLAVDVAHGASIGALEQLEWIAKRYSSVLLISGSVATAETAEAVWSAGADVVRLGLGNGSLCSTRIETGCGVPQMTALFDVFDEACKGKEMKGLSGTTFLSDISNRKFKIIADGGLRYAGDFVKALTNADAVMTGSLIAGTLETPGESFMIDGKVYKKYAGSSTHKANHIEGVAGVVEATGSVVPIIDRIMQGIRSGCSYVGAENLQQLKENAEFVEISSAGLQESHPHNKSLRQI
jgi:IMP dehydrogenase